MFALPQRSQIERKCSSRSQKLDISTQSFEYVYIKCHWKQSILFVGKIVNLVIKCLLSWGRMIDWQIEQPLPLENLFVVTHKKFSRRIYFVWKIGLLLKLLCQIPVLPFISGKEMRCLSILAAFCEGKHYYSFPSWCCGGVVRFLESCRVLLFFSKSSITIYNLMVIC